MASAPWRWALAGALVGGLLCLLVFFPARWVVDAVALASGQRVLLQGARGSIWNGSADSNLKCNTCHRLRFADVVTSFVLPAAST